MNLIKSVLSASTVSLCVSALPALASGKVESPATPQGTQLTSVEFVRLRCATDGSDVCTEWSGSVYGFTPGQMQKELFHIVGMNVSRCLQNEKGEWFQTSRELTYYLDPATDKILQTWKNPYTNEDVNVMHVANNPVQNPLTGTFKGTLQNNIVTAQLDVNLTYPNILSTDPKFSDYGNQALYQASELFKLTALLKDVQNSKKPSAPMILSWDRVGPWLPWMKMKDAPGMLIYSARGSKLKSFAELPSLLQQEINTRMPLYKSAPYCKLVLRNETSWSYFAKHLSEYLANANFPLPAPEEPDVCAVPPVM